MKRKEDLRPLVMTFRPQLISSSVFLRTTQWAPRSVPTVISGIIHSDFPESPKWSVSGGHMFLREELWILSLSTEIHSKLTLVYVVGSVIYSPRSSIQRRGLVYSAAAGLLPASSPQLSSILGKHLGCSIQGLPPSGQSNDSNGCQH